MDVEHENNEEQHLVSQIHDEIRKLRKSNHLLENNVFGLEFYNPIEKALVENNSLKVALDDNNLSGSIVKLNPVEDLKNDLQKEIDFIYKEISNLVSKIEDLKAFSDSLEQNSKNFQLMLEISSNSQDPSLKLDVIEKNIKQRFMKEKKELKSVITTLLPENPDLRDLIAQITEYFFSEGADKYMQMEKSDDLAEQTEFLLKTEMFELNPHDPTQIKLADLI
ncbi:UNVERIFIED_CONTAM: hypothetical protein PYX00_001667 [Menopon gallinae]|uniref:Uncharacterized protein n=1 Tax=Menopon gallinae TaxID=328185 RepID=A0AAW2IDM4_9NEOP